jgi:hypothetical protein
MIAASTICRRVRRWVTSCPGGGGRAAEPRQGGPKMTRRDRQYTHMVTGEEQRRAVAFSTGHLKPRREGSDGRRRGF